MDRHSTADEHLLALIEIPKGSRNKYEWDEVSGHVILDRFLSSSTVYPVDYGFLTGHRGEDGDPLDCLVCVSEPTFPGCIIPVKPVGLLKMHDEAGPDDKVVCVPLRDPGWSTSRTSTTCRRTSWSKSSTSSTSTRTSNTSRSRPTAGGRWPTRWRRSTRRKRREEDRGPGSVD